MSMIASLLLLLNLGGEACQEAALHDYVVHEWGTFTSFSGSDGAMLDFRTGPSRDLPAFIYDRQRFAEEFGGVGCGSPPVGGGKSGYVARQRMETPVIYFHSDKERVVNVSVQFRNGLITEFYPPARTMTPVGDVRSIPEVSSLDFGSIRIFPKNQTSELAKQIPSAGTSHYAYARDTDASVLRICGEESKSYYENFIFYRGIGEFESPLEVKGFNGKEIKFTTNEPFAATTALFVVQNIDGKISYGIGGLKSSAEEGSVSVPAEGMTREKFEKEIVDYLSDGKRVAHPLFRSEAQAMVNTWSPSWLLEKGTRVLYMVPEKVIDRVLPLRIEPKPKDLHRVFIGRLELLSPEREAMIKKGIEDMAQCCGGSKVEDVAMTMRTEFGRFAEAAVQSVVQKLRDETLQDYGRRLIIKIRESDGC